MADDLNVLLVTIDSLRRDMLGAYADRPRFADRAVETPNLDRFADRATVFESHYAGSLPCMPARREFLAGVQEFPWRGWGPLEPFDDPLPALAREAGAVTGLVTDHYHYLEPGGRGYPETFDGVEWVRGHEIDAWRTAPQRPGEAALGRIRRSLGGDAGDPGVHEARYLRNTRDFDRLDERDWFAPRVFTGAQQWVADDAGDWDRWLLYVDSFDVHEPFECPEPYASMYTDADPTDPDLPYWPEYGRVDADGASGLTDRELDFLRSQFAGKTTMVDRWFGRLLDRLDREGLWDDTLVAVTTDHGFLLGEHGWVGKNVAPVYDEVAHTPLLVWDPGSDRDRVEGVTSAVDVYATLLDALGADVPAHSHSRSVLPVLRDGAAGRDCAVYGYHGATVNVSDGRYTLFLPGDPDGTVHTYSTHQRGMDDPATSTALPYTDRPVWRSAGTARPQHEDVRLYDTREDPGQTENLAPEREETVERLTGLLGAHFDDLGVPETERDRFGL
ncbi:MAG: sulfatase-like hydrolase/transferase [Halobacteriaceae archaeon]